MHTNITRIEKSFLPGGMLARLGAAVLFLNLIAIAIAWWTISERRLAVYRQAESTVQNLSEVLAHDLTSILDKTDSAILSVVDEVNERGIESVVAKTVVARVIAGELSRRPDANALRIANARGDIILGAGMPQSGPINVADRDYFMRLQANPDAGLVISEPLVGRIGGNPGIVLARALKDRTGTFMGVVYAVISSSSFERMFSSLDVGPRGAITLRTTDLTLVARYTKGTASPSAIGSRTVSDELRNALRTGPDNGTFITATQLDGIERSNALRKLAKYPFYVLVGLATDDLLQEWKRNSAIALSILALYVAATIILFRLVSESWKRREAAIASLAKRESEFSRLSALAPGVIAQFQTFPDGRICVPYASDAMRSVFELAPEDVRESTAPILERMHPDDVQRGIEMIREAERTLSRFQREYRVLLPTKGERWLRSEFQPEKRPDGSVLWHGYVADVTDRKAIEDALRREVYRYTLLQRTAHDGIHVMNEQGCIVEANDAFCRMLGYSRDEVIGMNVTQWDAHLSPDEIQRTLRQRGLHNALFETRHKRKDGSVFDVEISTMWVEIDKQYLFYASVRDISQRKQAEQARRESDIHLLGILESTADGILAVDLEGRVLRTNRRFAEMWRIPQSLLDTDDDQALLNYVLDQLIDPAGFLDRVKALYQSDAEDIDTLQFKDGRSFDRVSIALVLDGAVVGRVWSFRDVTERKRIEIEVLEAQNQLQATLDAIPDLLFEVGLDGRIHDYHSPRTELLAVPPEAFLGKRFEDVLPPDAAKACMSALQEAQKMGVSSGVQYELPLAQGRHWFELSVSRKPVEPGGEPRVIVLARDITVRKELEESLRRLNEGLERKVAARTRELTDANAELQTVTYTLAHDLRAPARHVAGLAGQLAATYAALLEGRGKRWLDLMSDSANRQAELIEDMLAYMKLGAKEVTREGVGIEALAVEVASETPLGDVRAGKIEWRIGDLRMVEGDHLLIRVILSNLISNAVKYTAHTPHPVIEIGSVNECGNRNTYFVRDNGVGFDPARATKLFGLFQRLHDPANFPGNGIGLAIVKRLVEKHGGRVWAESSPGAGATFFFTLQAEGGGCDSDPE